jgi:hypothetical protein
VATCALTSCGSRHLAFRADDSLRISAPQELQRVELPVRIVWRAADRSHAALTGRGPFFAVFVDRPPVAAGSSLRTLVDDTCRRTPNCPDLTWFADRFVFVTGEKSVTIETVPADVTGTRTGADHTHRVTVVRVGPDGVRLDEAVASVEFAVVKA